VASLPAGPPIEALSRSLDRRPDLGSGPAYTENRTHPAPAVDHPSFTHFAEHSDSLKYLLLLGISAPRVITGQLPPLARPDGTIAVQKESDPATFLADVERWGVLAAPAKALLGSQIRLETFSNLELRLLVAHVALSSVQEVQTWLPSSQRRGELSRRLATRLAESAHHYPLWTIWQTLAYVRRPITTELLSQVGGDDLTDQQAAVLKECLLYPLADSRYVLHRTLQTDALSNPGTRDRRTLANTALTEYYTSRFADYLPDRPAQALLDQMEAFHHAIESGTNDVLDRFRPFFVDQLDALGRRLSYEDHEYAVAAEVFRQFDELGRNR